MCGTWGCSLALPSLSHSLTHNHSKSRGSSYSCTFNKTAQSKRLKLRLLPPPRTNPFELLHTHTYKQMLSLSLCLPFTHCVCVLVGNKPFRWTRNDRCLRCCGAVPIQQPSSANGVRSERYAAFRTHWQSGSEWERDVPFALWSFKWTNYGRNIIFYF